MRRRAFIKLLGGTALWPCAARAQPASMPAIGFLTTRSPEESATHTAAFLRGLRESGYVADRDVAIEYRWAGDAHAHLPTYARELAGLRPAAIAAGGDASALAAMAATPPVPVVFIIGDDPVRLGLVASLNRPGGRATGVSLVTSALGGKRLEFLCELVPDAALVALLMNPTNPNATAHIEEVKEGAQALRRQLSVIHASAEGEIEAGFEAAIGQNARALIVENDPFFDARRAQIVSLAARHRIPAIYHIREFPAAGGLISYGPSLADGYYELGAQTARVLKGTSPSVLPVVRPTKFELAINLKTAATLGLGVAPALLARADEVIE